MPSVLDLCLFLGGQKRGLQALGILPEPFHPPEGAQGGSPPGGPGVGLEADGGPEKVSAAGLPWRRLVMFQRNESALSLLLRRAAQAPILSHQVSAEACFPL